jgi:hypothetical protein
MKVSEIMNRLGLHGWFLLAMLLVVACGHLPEGVGSNHEIMVVCDADQWPRFEGILGEVFGREVLTPQEERVFYIRRGRPEEFDFYKKWKNLILLATFDHSGQTAELMEQFLSAEAREKVAIGEAHLFTRQNVWAQDQEVFFLAAEKEADLAEYLRLNSTRLFELMENALNAKITKFIYERGRRLPLERRLYQDYGWTLQIPKGYDVVKELPQEHFIWIRRQQPQRWIFVHWESSSDVIFTAQECIRWRDRAGEKYYQGDRIVPDYVTSEQVAFAGRRALRVTGIWENKELLVGGPFRTYCFYDQNTGRRYMVDAAVHAAGTEKEPYLRQVDLIIATFSTEPSGDWR